MATISPVYWGSYEYATIRFYRDKIKQIPDVYSVRRDSIGGVQNCEYSLSKSSTPKVQLLVKQPRIPAGSGGT